MMYSKFEEMELSRLMFGKIILLDTCTILRPGFPMMMREMEQELKRYGGCVLLPDAVIQELKKLRGRESELCGVIDTRMLQLAEWCRQGGDEGVRKSAEPQQLWG